MFGENAMNLTDRLSNALIDEVSLDYLYDLIIEAKAEIQRLQDRKLIAELSEYADAAGKFSMPDDFSVKVWSEGDDVDPVSVASLKGLLSKTTEDLYVPRSDMQRSELTVMMMRLHSIADHIHDLMDKVEKAIAKGEGIKL